MKWLRAKLGMFTTKDLYESYVAGRHDGHAAIIALMGMKNIHLANFQPISGPELVVDNEKAK